MCGVLLFKLLGVRFKQSRLVHFVVAVRGQHLERRVVLLILFLDQLKVSLRRVLVPVRRHNQQMLTSTALPCSLGMTICAKTIELLTEIIVTSIG